MKTLFRRIQLWWQKRRLKRTARAVIKANLDSTKSAIGILERLVDEPPKPQSPIRRFFVALGHAKQQGWF